MATPNPNEEMFEGLAENDKVAAFRDFLNVTVTLISRSFHLN